jgi:hypothetical protein
MVPYHQGVVVDHRHLLLGLVVLLTALAGVLAEEVVVTALGISQVEAIRTQFIPMAQAIPAKVHNTLLNILLVRPSHFPRATHNQKSIMLIHTLLQQSPTQKLSRASRECTLSERKTRVKPQKQTTRALAVSSSEIDMDIGKLKSKIAVRQALILIISMDLRHQLDQIMLLLLHPRLVHITTSTNPTRRSNTYQRILVLAYLYLHLHLHLALSSKRYTPPTPSLENSSKGPPDLPPKACTLRPKK